VPVNVASPEAFAEVAASPAFPPGFDLVATIDMGVDARAYRSAGATWILREIEPELGVAPIAAFIDEGPQP
jgi:hypothetical protein